MARRRKEPETAVVDAVTHDGRGIVSSAGKKVFVAGALEGESVRFRRRKAHRNYDEAELLDVLDASPDRIAARCAVFGICGGCAMQHIDTQRQRQIKAQSLRDALERIGGVEPAAWLEPIAGPDWHYRRRARLAVKDVPAKGRVLVGFRERHAPYITDMHRCEVLCQPADSLIDPLSELVATLTVRARLPQIEIAVADNATALVLRVLDTPSADDLAKLSAFGAANELRIYLQPRGLDSVELLFTPDAGEPLYYTLPDYDLKIEFAPVDFVQVNAEINRRMVSAALALLEPQPGDRILDLYCGIGNFSLALARQCSEVLGVEGEQSLVAAATANAALNGLDNVGFQRADLARIDGGEAWLRAGWDRVLLDPARSGAAEAVALLPQTGARRIVYVSCHPGTLARDAATLVQTHGYRLDAAGIIDMFPHTAHVESIAVFSK